MSEQNEDSDRIYCQSISKSISDVIRFSLDESFRKRSFKLFGVSCTVDTEKEIYKKLTALVNNKTAAQNRDNEDGVVVDENRFEQLPEPDKNKVTEIKSKNKEKDWLQISSQQYVECIKRKRACFYSQPDNKTEFFDCSNSELSNEALFKGTGSYYKEKFNSNVRFFSQ